jgi:hypothetical protein
LLYFLQEGHVLTLLGVFEAEVLQEGQSMFVEDIAGVGIAESSEGLLEVGQVE